MAIGKKNTRRNDLNAFALKLTLKDGEKFLDKPAFEVSQRKGDKYEKLPDHQYEVDGNLVRIEPRERVYEGNPSRSFTLTLEDNDKGEIYFVDVPFNSVGRGLANSILALKEFTKVQIGLYATKPKEEGGRSYPAASLRQNDGIVRWRYANDELPKPAEVTFKGKVQRDWTSTEVFLSEKLKELNGLIRKNSSSVPVTTVSNEVEEKDEVPF